MKSLRIVLCILSSLIAAPGLGAQSVDWEAVKKITPNNWILVETDRKTQCDLQRVTEDKLFCHANREGWLSAFSPRYYQNRQGDMMFRREEIREVRVVPFDYSQGPLSLLLAAGGGGGLDSSHQPTSFAGIKVGGPASLDLQYDRIQGNNGFSTEGSAVLPMFRVPRFQFDREVKFIKVYAEPGLGYRAGGGPFGGYSSAKVLVGLFTDTGSNKWTTPYIEVQRRFPFDSPLQGDTRLTFGLMMAVCAHCGIE
jgi:hypothetical protein